MPQRSGASVERNDIVASRKRMVEIEAANVPFRLLGGTTRVTPPSLSLYPDWARQCETRTVLVAPGAPHMNKKEKKHRRDTPEYYIIAAARAGCLLCLRDCLISGTSVNSASISGWNVWDNVHFSDNVRKVIVLRYVSEAGGKMSDKYASWLLKNRKSNEIVHN